MLESANMSSIQGLPTRGSDAKILLTRVHIHPHCMLVEFWGKFNLEKTELYKSLTKEIQSSVKQIDLLDGFPGDHCLVQIEYIWYRCRIVSGSGSNYTVFLIDEGITCHTVADKLAWGKKELFFLPPEVEFCVLTNVLPVSLENKWSPVALEFLRSLPGKCVNAHVQEVLVQQRIFVLNIPCLSKQMYEMGFAKKLSPENFLEFLLASLESKDGAEMVFGVQPQAIEAKENLQKQHLFFYPELPEETVETVVVTEVENPQKIFCQLKVFSRELTKLSEQLRQVCESRTSTCLIDTEMIGFPCAARGADGRWCRSVLQQVFPSNKVMQVLNVDYGTKQYVQIKNVRPLGAEFFRMPVVTYLCSLHGVNDKGLGWTTSQIEYLKSLLLFKPVIAKFEYQSTSEGVHYVTLYGDDNTNINNVFSLKDNFLPHSEKTIPTDTNQNNGQSSQDLTKQKENMSHPLEIKQVTDTLPIDDLALHSTHLAIVQHISNPSEFWIQTKTHGQELGNLMDRIYYLYKDSPSEDAIKNPTVGLYCAAKLENGDIYRATVTKVGPAQVKVFLVDYGNSEVLDRINIRPLPAEFKLLPRLALKCSLSSVKPKNRKWSQSASDFFFNVVTDKTVNAVVTSKSADGYAVHLSLPDAQGEKNVNTIMCSLGFAEKIELPWRTKATVAVQSNDTPAKQYPVARTARESVNKDVPFQNINSLLPAKNESRVTLFKENMFPIGSVLDVNVSCIKSPTDFWCQLVQNAGHLKMLMQDLQGFYADSVFVPPVETACVVLNPENGKWYRGVVIKKHETPHLDVLLVDYGQTKTVSLNDTRKICPEFLTLYSQAFRCSLLNPSVPTSAAVEWNEEATSRFQSFVTTAASNFVILKCTIYAVKFSELKVVFNVVDLETPFESISTIMVNLSKSVPEKAPRQSFHLDSYYYSSHNVKTGSEEQVTVTSVNDVGEFHCQLEKNSKMLKSLQKKVSDLCNRLEKENFPAVFGSLCFARYTDGQWYRGQIKATKPALLVHFVDYGDTIEVVKKDLFPVPKEASDIMTVPVQAVVCGLSDVTGEIPNKAASWFKTKVTEGTFRALIVAKETNGKLLVELYQANMQINAKIKKLFQLNMPKEEQVVFQRQKRPETANAFPNQANGNQTQPQKRSNTFALKPYQKRDEHKSANLDLTLNSKSEMCINSRKSAALKLYTPPPQRQSGDWIQSKDQTPSQALNLPKNMNSDVEAKHLRPKSPIRCQQENKAKKLPKLKELPPQSITSDLFADVYVSHCNGPMSFYVQCVKDEEKLISLVEQLNNPQTTTDANKIEDVQPGDLVQAEFADDSSWYRAFVREVCDKTALVEFVDFGNTALTSFSNLRKLDESLLRPPPYCTHCTLLEAVSLKKEMILDPDVVSAFKEDVSGCSEEKVFQCRFIRKDGEMWVVTLEDCGVKVVCKVPRHTSEVTSANVEKESVLTSAHMEEVVVKQSSRHYRQQELLEGQKLQVFITAINKDQTFWCQSANSDDLSKISSSLIEVVEKIDDKCINKGVLPPGSSCIALYSEDQLWYRAEVVETIGEAQNVLFVDYGNTSSVNTKDVREIFSDMVDIPQQAFLCSLEGFDPSCGSWLSCAFNEFSTLTVDKSLDLTVIKVTKEDGKINLAVNLEFEGVVINETMKTWWECFKGEPLQPPREQDSYVSESQESNNPPKQHDVQQAKSSEVITVSKIENSDQPSSFTLTEGVSTSTNVIVYPEESRNSQAFIELLEEETVPTDDLKLSGTKVTNDVTENDKDGEEVTSSFNACFKDEESNSMVEPEERGNFNAPEEQLLKTVIFNDESQHEEVRSLSHSSSFSGPSKQVQGKEASSVKDGPLSPKTSVRMIPREALAQTNRMDSHDDTDTILTVPSQILTEPIDPVTVQPTEQIQDVPEEQQPEDTNIVQKDGPDVFTALETQLTCKVVDDPTDLHPDADLSPEADVVGEEAPPSDVCTGIHRTVLHHDLQGESCSLFLKDDLCDAESKDLSEVEYEVEEFPQTEADPDKQEEKPNVCSPTEVKSEALETSVMNITKRQDSEEEDSISTEDEPNPDPDSFDEQEDGSVSDSDTIVYAESQELSQLVEEVINLVGEISFSDSCQANATESDSLVSELPEQSRDFDDGASTEEISAAEGSLAPVVSDDPPL